MIKSNIYKTNFYLDGKSEILKENNCYKIISEDLIKLRIKINKDSLIFWPNREGELLEGDNINKILSDYNIEEASICYPSTASMLFFMIFNKKENQGIVIFSKADAEGKISFFSLSKEGETSFIKIESKGLDLKIKSYRANSINLLFEEFLKDEKIISILPKRKKLSSYQVQLGFFTPYGEYNVPSSKGFLVSVDIAKLMRKYLGDNNIIHMFAYHGAHDSNYPQYFPSSLLGGKKQLKQAIDKIHQEKQRCSLYMNARLCSVENLELFPKLYKSIVKNEKGQEVIETYYGRNFYVMDPLSEDWRAILVENASYLKDLGADIIQLDQVAGRAAIGLVGKKWGEGYRVLIEEIAKLNLEVWIQGINEIYPANRFELCYRYPNILLDGTIRGGHPFGISYPLIPKLLKDQNYIIPIGNSDLLNQVDPTLVTVDLEHQLGQLSIYSQAYMDSLIKILESQK